MRFVLFTLCAAAFLLLNSSYKDVHAQERSAPVVVELFTSQSCSSCPPADKALGEIAMQDGVIALSCHVTYWNHLHWEDTLSREFCTQRQRSYAAIIKGGRVYTPQAVINGRQHLIGSRKAKILEAIDEAHKSDGVKLVTLIPDKAGQVTLNLPALAHEGTYQITLFEYKTDYLQEIPSGENRGKAVRYTHPVSAMNILDLWQGVKEERKITLQDSTADGIAVLVQDGVSGHIVAAGDLRLHSQQ